MQYVELHARSAFSFLEGASLPETLATVCAAQNIPGMALLDRHGVYGSPRFHMAAKKTGIRAYVGAELAVEDPHGTANYPLLCQSRQGYQNLCRLLTKIKLRVPKHAPATATSQDLEEYSPGLICLTGDESGPLAMALKAGGSKAGKKLLTGLIHIFGEKNVYVEIQRHLQREEEQRNQAAVLLARELGLPILATNGVCHATPAEMEVLDVFTCIKHKRKLETAGRLLSRNAERHIKNAEQMTRLFADIPEAIHNTVELAARLQFSLKNLGYEFPKYPVPDGGRQIDFLRTQVALGARERFQPLTERAEQQLKRELDLIEQRDLAGYFLIVWDIVRFAKSSNILIQGRGSAANSATCYALGITAIDP